MLRFLFRLSSVEGIDMKPLLILSLCEVHLQPSPHSQYLIN